jgi:tRNA modification GTPase
VLLESVELRQASFILWLTDLSSPDPYFILPIINGAAMFMTTKLSPNPAADPIQQKIMGGRRGTEGCRHMASTSTPPPTDTIAAIATPPGAGGVGVLRISGSAVPNLFTPLLGQTPAPRVATLAAFLDGDGQAIDQGLALYFPAPHSFTGEHVLELQGHGGPVVMNLLLQRALALGARMARPGEFSERAFLNDKLDLAQAEAIADLIAAGTEQAARAAQRSLQGEFSRRITDLVERLVQLRVYVEAAIDFPDEEVDFLADPAVVERLQEITELLAGVRQQAHHGQLLRDGLTLALAGRPNAGKSSLLNALAGSDRAIVTDIAGTTRDVLREAIQIDGIPLHIMDTAGLRDSDDQVEREGVRRAREALQSADHVLLVHDESGADATLWLEVPPGTAFTEVHNKIDVSGDPPRLERASEGEPARIWLSAQTGEGVELLKQHLKSMAGVDPSGGGSFTARTRHLEALGEAAMHLDQGRHQLTDHQAGELLAEELRLAQNSLGTITGEISSDELLGRIFASFCIGK